MTDFSDLAARYIAVWNETDSTERRRRVDALWTPEARYIDPMVEAQGREAIDAAVASVQQQFPGFVFRLVGPVDAHHDQARFNWELVPGDDESDAPAPVVGFDVVQADEHGRIDTVLGFLDRVPAA